MPGPAARGPGPALRCRAGPKAASSRARVPHAISVTSRICGCATAPCSPVARGSRCPACRTRPCSARCPAPPRWSRPRPPPAARRYATTATGPASAPGTAAGTATPAALPRSGPAPGQRGRRRHPPPRPVQRPFQPADQLPQHLPVRQIPARQPATTRGTMNRQRSSFAQNERCVVIAPSSGSFVAYPRSHAGRVAPGRLVTSSKFLAFWQ
jgi:hypothetical protein